MKTHQRVLFPHLEALQRLAEQQNDNILTEQAEFANLFLCIANYYQYQQGQYAKSLTLYKRTLKIFEIH